MLSGGSEQSHASQVRNGSVDASQPPFHVQRLGFHDSTSRCASYPFSPIDLPSYLVRDNSLEIPFYRTWRLLVTDIDGAAQQASEVFLKLTLVRFAFHVAATGAAAKDRELVPDELAAPVGEDRRTAGETCPVLLVVVSGEPPDWAAVCQYAGADRWTAASVGIA